jgi:hypothetical protein
VSADLVRERIPERLRKIEPRVCVMGTYSEVFLEAEGEQECSRGKVREEFSVDFASWRTPLGRHHSTTRPHLKQHLIFNCTCPYFRTI